MGIPKQKAGESGGLGPGGGAKLRLRVPLSDSEPPGFASVRKECTVSSVLSHPFSLVACPFSVTPRVEPGIFRRVVPLRNEQG